MDHIRYFVYDKKQADAMLRLLSNPDERERYAHKAKERVKNALSPEKIASQASKNAVLYWKI